MTTCPLCSDILLRHLRSGKSYWLCRRCRVEILEKKDSIEKKHSNYESGSKTLPLSMPAPHAVVHSPALEHEPVVSRVQGQQPPMTTEV